MHFLGFHSQRVKRDPVSKTPLSVCRSVTRLYLIIRDPNNHKKIILLEAAVSKLVTTKVLTDYYVR